MFPNSPPSSILAQPLAPPTSNIEEHRAEAIAALDTTALQAMALEPVPAPASSEVDLSPVAQFQSALAQSHQLLDGLQAAEANATAAASTQQLSSPDQLSTLTDAAQNLVAAFNVLQTGDVDSTGATAQAPLLSNLLESVTQPDSAAAASQVAGPATLADVGITLQPPQPANADAALALDAQALQTAFAANPQGTLALLNQTTDTFGQLGDQFAQQASVDVSPAVGVNAGVPQGTQAGLALDAFAGSATPAQPVVSALNEQAAQNQLDHLNQQQQQQQLDAARDAFSAQTSALQAQGKTQLEQQAAQLLSAQQLINKLASDASAKILADSVTQLRVVEEQRTAGLAANASAVALADVSAQLARAQETQALADGAARTVAENAAIARLAAPQNQQAAGTAADLAAADTIGNAQSALATSTTAATLLPNPAAPDNASARSGGGVNDRLAVNPALAAAIAAYNLGGAQAAIQSRPAAAPPRPDRVQEVKPVQPVDSASDAPPR